MGILTVILSVIVGFGIYFLPSIKAFYAHKPNAKSILILNILAGWTVIGWVIALIWAFSKGGAQAKEVAENKEEWRKEEDTKHCPECGKRVVINPKKKSDSGKFCPNCGARLVREGMFEHRKVSKEEARERFSKAAKNWKLGLPKGK